MDILPVEEWNDEMDECLKEMMAKGWSESLMAAMFMHKGFRVHWAQIKQRLEELREGAKRAELSDEMQKWLAFELEH